MLDYSWLSKGHEGFQLISFLAFQTKIIPNEKSNNNTAADSSAEDDSDDEEEQKETHDEVSAFLITKDSTFFILK